MPSASEGDLAMPVRSLARWSRPALAALGLSVLTLFVSAVSPVGAQTPPAAPPPRISQQAIGNLRITMDSAAGAPIAPIPLFGFAIEMSQPTSIGSATGGAGAGKATFTDAVVVKQIDELTPRLFDLFVRDTTFQSVEINLCRNGSDCTSMTALISYTLRMAGLTDLAHIGGSPSTEHLTFTYGALTMRAGQTTTCYNRSDNVACPTTP